MMAMLMCQMSPEGLTCRKTRKDAGDAGPNINIDRDSAQERELTPA